MSSAIWYQGDPIEIKTILFSTQSVDVAMFNRSCKTTKRSFYSAAYSVQEAQLPQRDSASATHVFLCSLADRALHWTSHLLYNYIID